MDFLLLYSYYLQLNLLIKIYAFQSFSVFMCVFLPFAHQRTVLWKGVYGMIFQNGKRRKKPLNLKRQVTLHRDVCFLNLKTQGN